MPRTRNGTSYSAPGKQVGGRAKGVRGSSNKSAGSTATIISDIPDNTEELDQIQNTDSEYAPPPPKRAIHPASLGSKGRSRPQDNLDVAPSQLPDFLQSQILEWAKHRLNVDMGSGSHPSARNSDIANNIASDETSQVSNTQPNLDYLSKITDPAELDYAKKLHKTPVYSSAGITNSVPSNIKKAILQLEYINFNTLLPNLEPIKDQVLRFDSNGIPRLGAATQKFLTWEQWCRAWDTYMACNIEAHKRLGGETVALLAVNMLTYKRHVTNFRAAGGAWLAFDEAFRRQYQGQAPPWADYPVDLAFTFQAGYRGGRPAIGEGRDRGHRSYNTCNAYNAKPEGCPHNPCRYKHICAICSEPHPKSKCPQRGQGGGQDRGK